MELYDLGMDFRRLIARRVLRAIAAASLLLEPHLGTAQGSTAASDLAGPRAQVISLDEALRRAAANEPAFAAAVAQSRVQALERKNARAALLPTAIYHNQAIYTEPNGVPTSRIGQTAGADSPIFIANNSIREYASQGVFNETIGLGQVGAIRLADANASLAVAEAEVARRGLIATIVNLYYGVAAQESKLKGAERARREAADFVHLTTLRETAREAAHADVLKAQLQLQQRERELADAQLLRDKARLELAVLLFPDPTTPFETIAEDVPAPLPELGAIEALARENNPQINSALASLQVNRAESYIARAALLPELGLNVTYGIDAPQFATKGLDSAGAQTNNLGYSGSVSLDIPVWDWLTNERKIKQSRIRQDAAKVALTATQRRVLANLSEFYAEAEVARNQLESLNNSVQLAGESLRLTKLRYASGEATAFEVVDAQTALVTAETAKVDGVVRYHLALAQLQTLTGKL